jgi:hypothetical protein
MKNQPVAYENNFQKAIVLLFFHLFLAKRRFYWWNFAILVVHVNIYIVFFFSVSEVLHVFVRTSTFSNEMLSVDYETIRDLLPWVPKFDDTPKRTQDWLWLLENHFKLIERHTPMPTVMTYNEKIDIATTHMMRNPWYLYKKARENVKNSCMTRNDFNKLILDTFVPVSFQYELRNEVRSLKQSGNKFNDCLNEFNHIAEPITDMHEMEKICYFMNGIKRNVSREIMHHNPKHSKKQSG